ncbi:MAG: hypothetical protein A2041_13365 [Bacteroidetes bacterium GWA2_31_9b]|nr:MAG: hypothetical protein A2041_13365 [Bacteroidetes bacterium GWA2_31_9b]
MKKISLWLNIALIIAVAVLYFLFFTGKGKISKSDISINEETGQQIDRSYPIAYVNMDTLYSKYNMFIDKRDAYLQKRDESQAELQLKMSNLEKQAMDFQNEYSKGLMTRTKAQMVQQELGQKEQELYATRDNLAMQLSEEEQVMNRQILNSIVEYLKVYNNEHNYKYILSSTFGGQVLYTDSSLNITYDVLKGLNEKYAKEKGKN